MEMTIASGPARKEECSGHQLQKDPCKPDRFLGEVAATLVGADHVVPTDAEGGVNGLNYGVEPRRQIALLRDFERNATTADFCLRAKETLPHGLRCDEKGLGNACSIQAQY